MGKVLAPLLDWIQAAGGPGGWRVRLGGAAAAAPLDANALNSRNLRCRLANGICGAGKGNDGWDKFFSMFGLWVWEKKKVW